MPAKGRRGPSRWHVGWCRSLCEVFCLPISEWSQAADPSRFVEAEPGEAWCCQVQ